MMAGGDLDARHQDEGERDMFGEIGVGADAFQHLAVAAITDHDLAGDAASDNADGERQENETKQPGSDQGRRYRHQRPP